MTAYQKHLVLPVVSPPMLEVHAFIAGEQRRLETFRPDPYDCLTIVSHEDVVKRIISSNSLRPKEAVRRWIETSAPPLEIDGYFLDARSYDPNNVAHLLLWAIPLCRIASQAVGDLTFVFRDLQPTFRSLLEYFGIRPVCTRRPLKGRSVEAFLTRNLDHYSIFGASDPVTSFVDGIYDDFQARSGGSRKIYISRKGPRSLVNEAEVRELLENRGYETLYMDEWSIEQQVAIVQSADDIVAIHGAAMGYLALNKQMSSVVELMPNHVGTALFPIAYGSRAGRYCQVISEFDDAVQYAGWGSVVQHKNVPFAVNLDMLSKALPQGT